MRFLFLNQYGPPDPVPTARLLGELAGYLRQQGHAVEIISPRQSYHGRPARGSIRLRRELAALGAILRAGWSRQRPPPEVVLALTSPPGLLVVAALLALRHRALLAHWAMDLYPELALALGETGPGPTIGRGLTGAMRWAYRRCALIVALDPDMRAHLEGIYGVKNVCVRAPWPSAETERQLAAADVGGAAQTPGMWLYSGNLGRAHEWRTLLDAQQLLEHRNVSATLVFQGDGSARSTALAYGQSIGLQRCEWRDYVPDDALIKSLLSAQVLVATQRPETRGLLWPSKVALLERLPRPVLYVGPVEGAIAQRLRERAGTGVFAPGQAEGVAAWVEDALRAVPTGSGRPVEPQPSALAEGCRELETWLMACQHA